MKEVTEWNGKPRYMWCWYEDENLKSKRYVLCILTEEEMIETGTDYPVRVIDASCYLHCAEIEEETKKETQLSYYELSQLLKCFGVECRNNINAFICSDVVYAPEFEDEGEEVSKDCKIRYRQGEWEEPTRETVWKWWGDEIPNSDVAKIVSFLGWDKE